MSLYLGKKSDNVTPIVHLTSTTNQDISYLNNDIKLDTLIYSGLPYISVANCEVLVNDNSNLNTPSYPFSSTAHSYFYDSNYTYMMLYYNYGVYQIVPQSTFFDPPNLSTNRINGISYVGEDDAKGILLIQFKYTFNQDTSGIIVNNKDIVVNGVSLLAMNNLIFASTATPLSNLYNVYPISYSGKYLHVIKNNTVYTDSSLELTSTSLKLSGYTNGLLKPIFDSSFSALPASYVSYHSYTLADMVHVSGFVNGFYIPNIGTDFEYLFIYIDGIVYGYPPTSYTHSSFHWTTILKKYGAMSTLLQLSTHYATGDKEVNVVHTTQAYQTSFGIPLNSIFITSTCQQNDPLNELNVRIIKMMHI